MEINARSSRATPWVVLGTACAIASVVLLAWGVMRRETTPPPRPETAGSRAHIEIAIEGMDCVMCAAGLQSKLRALPGVTKAEVSFQEGKATIVYDPRLIKPDRFADLVKEDGLSVGR